MAVNSACCIHSHALCGEKSLYHLCTNGLKARATKNVQDRIVCKDFRSLTWHLSSRNNLPRAPMFPKASQRDSSITVEELNQHFGCIGVRAEQGEGKLPKVVLQCESGSEAEIYLFGACITSWKIPNGKDMLFVRPDAVFSGQKPISGGIPHCFPQFGPGAIQQHGFARNMTWSVVSAENLEGKPSVTLELKDSPYSKAMWNFSFSVIYKVVLDSKTLSTNVTVKNTDKEKFTFTAGLHTYFRASAIDASVQGLKGCTTLNKFPDPLNPISGLEEREAVNFPGFVDCVYLDAPEKLHFRNGLGDVIYIENKSWTDAVLWNPHMQMENCYKDFVCVENVKIRNVELEPGQKWSAEQYLHST